jgi:cytochrome c556
MKKVKFYPVLSANEQAMVEAIAKGYKMQTPYEFEQFQELAQRLKESAERAIESLNVASVGNYIATLTEYKKLLDRIKAEKVKFDADFDKECGNIRKLIQEL